MVTTPEIRHVPREASGGASSYFIAYRPGRRAAGITRGIWLSVSGLVSLVTASAVQAASDRDLEARIKLLENELNAVKEQLADRDEKTNPVSRTAQDEIIVDDSVWREIEFGETRLEVGGFVDLDVHLSKYSDGDLVSGSIGRDLYLPLLTPVSPDNPTSSSIDTDFSAKTSRISLATVTPVGNHAISTRIEMDFLLSPGGNERISNSYNPRLRRAYVDYDGWRIGQDWTTFQTLQAMPESASFFAPAESQVFVRQPMIRYTTGNFQLALENPNTNLSGVGLTGDGALPDAVLRYNLRSKDYDIAVSALVRQLRYRDAGINAKAFGWGVSLAGRVYLGTDDIRFSLQGGEGIGRYVGLGIAPAAVLNAASTDIVTIPVLSGNVAYRWMLGNTSISGGYSFIRIDNHKELTGPAATAGSQSAFVALTHSLAPKLTVAAEFLYGERKIESGLKGDIRRLTFSVRQGF